MIAPHCLSALITICAPGAPFVPCDTAAHCAIYDRIKPGAPRLKWVLTGPLYRDERTIADPALRGATCFWSAPRRRFTTTDC